MYQWHPHHVQWGNISWGHAVSKDLVTWKDMHDWRGGAAVALAPGPGEYDELSVFTGTVQPVNITGGSDGTLLALYTSIRALPTNWKLPYIPGTESQSLATSVDGGKTWRKYKGNPVIEGHPKGWNITGFRDPFFQAWPEMDTLLGQEEEHFYMVMGSGIKDVGPRIPLYSAKKSDLTKWTFLGALWEPKMNETFGHIEATGSFGYVTTRLLRREYRLTRTTLQLQLRSLQLLLPERQRWQGPLLRHDGCRGRQYPQPRPLVPLE